MTRALKAALGIVLCAGCFSEWKGPGQPPVASVQCKPQVALGASMTLDGTQSFDPEEEYLGFQWTVLVAPDGSQAKPLEQTPTTAEISPDTEGEYVVELTVTDASGLSARALARFEASGVSSPGTGDPWFEPPSGGSWSRRRQIRIDNSKLGEELTNFPLLVLLHAARVDLGFV